MDIDFVFRTRLDGDSAIKLIKEKIAAFETLTDQTPEILITGDFIDKKSRDFIFVHNPVKVETVKRHVITASIDGEMTDMIPATIEKIVFSAHTYS